jgi:hypothetical protein
MAICDEFLMRGGNYDHTNRMDGLPAARQRSIQTRS